jgi:hypothetical protein
LAVLVRNSEEYKRNRQLPGASKVFCAWGRTVDLTCSEVCSGALAVVSDDAFSFAAAKFSALSIPRDKVMAAIESAVREDVDSTRCENLGGKEDAYNGITVDASSLPPDIEAFRLGLKEALEVR